MPTVDQFIEAARQVAPAFGLDPVDIALLGHSENVVLDATLRDGTHVAMRLHRPGYNTADEMKSEVLWVKALADAGLPVPSPVPTIDGGHYVTAMCGTEPRHVGVVEWVDGTPLGGPIDGAETDVVPQYVGIGRIAAQIHKHSTRWEPPAGFSRRAWDADGLVGEHPLWGRFWEVDELTATQRDLFARTRLVIQDELISLGMAPDRYGLIHSDLHLGNVMADQDGALTIIDFDDAGYGWFMHELAVALHPGLDEPWEDRARAAIVEGYRSERTLTDADDALIDTFLTMRSLMIVGWLDARRELPVLEHLPDLVSQAANACERYLATA